MTTDLGLQLLQKINCCPRCIHRFNGIRSKEIHLSLVSNPLIPSKRSVDQVNDDHKCPACLGILQSTNYNQLATNAFKKLNEFKLMNKTFQLNLGLPSQLVLRQASIKHYLEKELNQKVNMVQVKEIVKLLLIDSFERVSGFSYDSTSPLSLCIHFKHTETENEYQILSQIPESKLIVKTHYKKGIQQVQGASAEKIMNALERIDMDKLIELEFCPPKPITTDCQALDLYFNHDSIYIAGRYCKLQRHISNSVWIINGKRMTQDSIEELIAGDTDVFVQADSHKFSSAGREDADVLMLGRGRPFYLELMNPKMLSFNQADITELESRINLNGQGKIKVYDLQQVTRESTRVLKDSANTKSKSYSCLVKLSQDITQEQADELSSIVDLPIKQRNPTRVPRRSDLIRDKVIEKLSISAAPNYEFPTSHLQVELKTSAGTYVKEFIHGDDGRTVPCLKSLLKVETAECVSLDVLQVFLDWPSMIHLSI